MPKVNQHTFFKPQRNWGYVIPTVTLGVVGVIFLPHFTLGLAIGLCELLLSLAIHFIVSKLFLFSTPDQREYLEVLTKHPLLATLCAPIVEECLFRGILQPLLIGGLLLCFPQFPLVVICALAVSLTAVLFGAAHLSNAKEGNAYTQAIITTIAGVVFGIIALQFGLFAAIAAHMMANTVAITGLMLSLPVAKNAPVEETHAAPDFAPAA